MHSNAQVAPAPATTRAAEGMSAEDIDVTTETTDAPTEARPDQYMLAYEPLTLSVFVQADGELTIHASALGVFTSVSVPAHLADAFRAAISTPYSGGIGRC